MQIWTRQSRCIFCEFQAVARSRNPSFGNRACYSKAKPKSERKHHDPNTRRFIDRYKYPIARNGSKNAGKILAEEEKENIQEQNGGIATRLFVERALRRAVSHLKSRKMSKSSDVSQMKGLDPDGVLWPQFEDSITQLLDSQPINATLRNLSDHFGIKREEFDQEIDRKIKFAFFDFVLNHRRNTTIGTEVIDLRYPTEWYPSARQIQRVIHLHVGPTNSGKTYNALKRLEQSGDGFYAGPLRLLAHEVYSRFNSRGIKCDLITGDDVRLDESGGVQLYASTVEMVDSGRVSEVGVIDEIQMLGDIDRGWAWTRALLSAQAKELHLCGEARAVPLVREIVASMGDTLHVHRYERLNPLKVMSKSLKGNLQNLRKGDCVVSFSIVSIHHLKRQIELDTGRRCAIVYGGLPPETRAQQAALFNDPENDYDFLVASDAIGMGLNLSIKRIVFESTKKFNGVTRETLSIPQLKQIAGRAGRYRTANDDNKHQVNTSKQGSRSISETQQKPKSIGLVTCLDEQDLPILHKALSTDGPPLKAAGILPPGEFYEDLASGLPEDTPFEYILRRMNAVVATNERFRICDIRDNLDIARAIEEVEDLTIPMRLMFCAAPASFRRSNLQDTIRQVLIALAKTVGTDTPVTVADVPEIPLEVLDEPISPDRGYLASLENLHKSLILYLWLSYRFPRTLRDQDMAIRAKELCEEKINTTLLKVSANPKLRAKLENVRKSSELLSEQTKARGLVMDMPLMMNPDQSVDEVESARTLTEADPSEYGEQDLEKKVEFERVLDLGEEDDAAVKEVMHQTDQQHIQNLTEERRNDADDHQRATSSG